MPESIDWPLKSHPQRPGRRILLFLLAVVVAIVLGARTAISYWVDLLWFGTLGYQDVFWKTLGLKWGIFTAFAAVTFVVLYATFAALKRAHSGDLPVDHTIFIAGNAVNLPVAPVLRLLSIGVSFVVAIATGAAMEAQWPTLALFWYAPHVSGSIVDPIFGWPLNFYLFTLPALELIAGWLLTLAVLACILAFLFILITGGTRALSGGFGGGFPLPLRGLSITVGFLLLVVALRVYLSRFELLFEHHTIFDGVTYTDAHVTLTGHAGCVRGPRAGSADRLGRRRFQAARALADRLHRSRGGLLCRGWAGWLVRHQLSWSSLMSWCASSLISPTTSR